MGSYREMRQLKNMTDELFELLKKADIIITEYPEHVGKRYYLTPLTGSQQKEWVEKLNKLDEVESVESKIIMGGYSIIIKIK